MPQTISLNDLDFQSKGIDIQRVAEAFKTHGAIVVRGLLREYIDALHRDSELYTFFIHIGPTQVFRDFWL